MTTLETLALLDRHKMETKFQKALELFGLSSI
jgi:hypothetical protein